MQLMWLSGPTGNVRTISITTRTVLTAAVVVGLFLVTAGFLLHFVGSVSYTHLTLPTKRIV